MATSDSIDSQFTIQLTRGYETVVDEIDKDLSLLKWQILQNRNGKCYAAGRSQSGKAYLHRLVLERVLGRQLSRQEYVDHIDGNGLNNRRGNLRLASAAQNQWNSAAKPNNTSGYKGVGFCKITKKWRARIRIGGKSLHLGLYDTPEDAHLAYCDAALKYHGEFANFGV